MASAGAVSLVDRTDARTLAAVPLLRRQRSISLLLPRVGKTEVVGLDRERLSFTVPTADLLSLPWQEPGGLPDAQVVRQRPPVPRRISRAGWRLAADVLDLLKEPNLPVFEPTF